MSSATAHPSVRRWALVSMIGLLALLAAGAAVNALGATLSVPDWPLSYGKVLPFNFVGNATHEQTHRLLAALCWIALTALAVVTARHERRSWVRRLAFTAVGLYYAQILAGGVIVLALAPVWLSALHQLLAQLTFVLTFVVVVACSKGWEMAREGHPQGRRLAMVVLVAAGLQVTLGALSRHPPVGQAGFIVALLLHLAVALVLLVLVIVQVVRLARQDAPQRIRSTARMLLLLVVIQIALGLPLFVVSPEPGADEHEAPRSFSYLHISHVMLAALVLAHASAIYLRTRA